MIKIRCSCCQSLKEIVKEKGNSYVRYRACYLNDLFGDKVLTTSLILEVKIFL